MPPPETWAEAVAAAAPAATLAAPHFAPPLHPARQGPSRPSSASRATASPHPPGAAVRSASTGSMGTPPGSPLRAAGDAAGHADRCPLTSTGSYGTGKPHQLPAFPAASVPGALYHGYLGPMLQGDTLGFMEAPATPAALWADPKAPYAALTPFGTSPYGSSFSAPLTSSNAAAAESAAGARHGRQVMPQPQPAALSPSEAMHAAIAAEHPNIAQAWLNNRKAPLMPPPPAGVPGQQYTRSTGDEGL